MYSKPTVGFSKYVKVRNYCYARGLIIRRSSARGRIWWLPFRRRCYCYNTTGLQVTKAEPAVPAFVYTTRSYPTANAIPMADTTSALLHPISVYYVQCIMFIHSDLLSLTFGWSLSLYHYLCHGRYVIPAVCLLVRLLATSHRKY